MLPETLYVYYSFPSASVSHWRHPCSSQIWLHNTPCPLCLCPYPVKKWYTFSSSSQRYYISIPKLSNMSKQTWSFLSYSKGIFTLVPSQSGDDCLQYILLPLSYSKFLEGRYLCLQILVSTLFSQITSRPNTSHLREVEEDRNKMKCAFIFPTPVWKSLQRKESVMAPADNPDIENRIN